jgi:hypothetical protein
LESPWVRSAIWRKYKHGHWEVSMTSKSYQCLNQQSVGHEPRFNNDNWECTISIYFESAETDLHIAEHDYFIDYADTWSSKGVHRLSKGPCTNCSSSNSGCGNMVKFNPGVAWVRLPIMRIHPQVAWESNTQRWPATLHKKHSVNHCRVCHEPCIAIPVLDPIGVEMVYCHFASCYHCLQWHV